MKFQDISIMLTDSKLKILDFILNQKKNYCLNHQICLILIGELMHVVQMIHQILKLMLAMEIKD